MPPGLPDLTSAECIANDSNEECDGNKRFKWVFTFTSYYKVCGWD